MENFTPLSALSGGALIGVSGIMNGVFKAPKNDRFWQLFFLAGLVMGSLVFQWLFPAFNRPRQNYPLLLLGAGGFLVGFGASMANGCISGHGICGIANRSIRSITATTTFMATGMITVFVIRHLFGAGA